MSPGEYVRENYRKQGADAERERIIKLLQQHHKQTKAGNTEQSRKYEAAVLACIALIKGENK